MVSLATLTSYRLCINVLHRMKIDKRYNFPKITNARAMRLVEFAGSMKLLKPKNKLCNGLDCRTEIPEDKRKTVVGLRDYKTIGEIPIGVLAALDPHVVVGLPGIDGKRCGLLRRAISCSGIVCVD